MRLHRSSSVLLAAVLAIGLGGCDGSEPTRVGATTGPSDSPTAQAAGSDESTCLVFCSPDDPAPTDDSTASPLGENDSASGDLDDLNEPTGPTEQTSPDDDSTGSSDSAGGLDQGDWNDICAGGACDPRDGMPNFTPGGGLAFPTNP